MKEVESWSVMGIELALVEWEDITGHVRQEVPNSEDEIEPYRLIKHTIGYIKQFERHLLVITDFDVSHKGRDYRDNDFTIIPNGVIRKITYLSPVRRVPEDLSNEITFTDEEVKFE